MEERGRRKELKMIILAFVSSVCAHVWTGCSRACVRRGRKRKGGGEGGVLLGSVYSSMTELASKCAFYCRSVCVAEKMEGGER